MNNTFITTTDGNINDPDVWKPIPGLEQTALGPIVRNSEVTVGHIRQIIADLPDDAPVEILLEGSYSVLIPTGASVCMAVNCRDGLQLYVRKEQEN